jgi:DMSO reductase anchor subunit
MEISPVTESHNSDTVRETPSQGIFIGWLALVLMFAAIVVAGIGLYASSLHVG